MDAPTRLIGDTTQLLRRATVDTDAIQEMIDRLPYGGGTIKIPAGDWLIDCARSIKTRNNLRVLMQPDTNLIALPNALPKYGVFDLSKSADVEIVDGHLIGDRDFHDYTALLNGKVSTHEWGHGIRIFDCERVTIRGTRMSNFPGDGMSVGAGAGGRDIAIFGVTTNNCRRQGLSLVECNGVLVYGSQFLNTIGTSPECGIDIEPEADQIAKNITINNCVFRGNNKYGINVLQRTGAGIVDTVDIDSCLVEGQVSNGIVLVFGKNVRVRNNTIRRNNKTGIDINNTVGYRVEGNTFAENYGKAARTTPLLAFKGWSSKIQSDVYLRNATPATGMGTNNYR